MAKLTSKERNTLPKQQVKRGKLSPGQAAKIRAKANAILGGGC